MKQKISLKARALRYLSAREHSRKELAGKLLPYAGEGDDMDALLKWLEEQNFLSDERFSEALIRRRAIRYGSSRILHELKKHDVDDAYLESAKQVLAEDEIRRALDVWKRKFDKAPSDQKERARQMRFLQQRGFSTDIIRSLMKKVEK